MTMTLNFLNTPADNHFKVEAEDREMGYQIGILTPREIIPSDRVADWIHTDRSKEEGTLSKMESISWAQRVSGAKPKTPQQIRDQEISELEFMLLQADKEGDDIEDMLDTLSLDWEQDMDRTVLDAFAPFGYTAGWNEYFCPKTTQVVRVVGEFQKYFIGSIGGAPPSVYIPKEILLGELQHHLHCFYLLDLDFTPGLRNQWRATFCHPPLPTAPMWQTTQMIKSDEDSRYIIKETFVVPMPPSYIGAIIGKNGKNINALIKRVKDTTVDPEITLTPGEDGEHIVVDVIKPEGCNWTSLHSIIAVSHMHC